MDLSLVHSTVYLHVEVFSRLKNQTRKEGRIIVSTRTVKLFILLSKHSEVKTNTFFTPISFSSIHLLKHKNFAGFGELKAE